MDPFTEKLLERTRARRENLQKKMAERPNASNRPMAKRLREPLTDSNSVISEPVSEKVPQVSSKPSPSKRRCSGENAQPAAGEENQEPMIAQPAAPMLTDPPTDKKPPAGPASIRPLSSLEKTPTCPAVQSQPGLGNKARLEPEKMAVTPAPDPPSSRVETSASSALQGSKSDHVEDAAPSAAGMRSRLQRLAEQRKGWDSSDTTEANTDLTPLSLLKRQTEVPPAAVPTPSSGTPVGRRGRLANLAATIGSWEDDLSHANIPTENVKEKPGTAVSKFAVRDSKPSAVSHVVMGSAAPSKTTFTSDQALRSPVKSSRVVPPSPQKADIPTTKPALQSVTSPHKSSIQGTAVTSSPQKRTDALSSPQKTTLSMSTPVPQSPLKSSAFSKGHHLASSTQKPDQPLKPVTAGQALSQEKASAGTPGVKSFLERFGERCQERTNQSSPAGGTPHARTPAGAPSAITPNTRLVQERLRAAQAAQTTTADLTQKQKLEREAELAQIRSRFQNGNSARKNKEEPTEINKNTQEQRSTPVEVPVEVPVEPQNTPTKKTQVHELVVSPPASTSSFQSLVTHTVENKDKAPENEEEEDKEIEMNVDESINSAVINGLFDGILEQAEEQDDAEEEEEDPLNISSMSILAPLQETVAAVVKSPPRMMTSTPANSFIVKNTTPNYKPSKFQKTNIIRAASSDSLEASDEDLKLPYSVDAYRSTRVKETERPNVKQVIVRKEDVSQRAEESRGSSLFSVKQKMKVLTNEMNLQQTVIHQASQALNCCTDEEHGKGSQVEAEAQRLLLVATEKRETLKAELDHLKGDPKSQKKAPPAPEATGMSASKGSITLQELRLPLKTDFVCSTANKPDATKHSFFVMIRAGADNTVATPLASTHHGLSGDTLTFPTKFTISEVCSNFEVDIEVYGLVQKREVCSDKKKKPNKSKAITPKRFLAITKSVQTPVVASPGGPNAVRTSDFVLVGSHKLTLASIGKNKFPLEKVPFLCPLEGHIYLKIQCEVGSKVEEKGFLTMFEDVSGFGAWHRRWCVLSGYCISYWTYPDDEKRKGPIGRINLANCTSKKVDPANREFCARPNTFELITVRPQRADDRETLVSQCQNTMCVTKNWLSADTKDERNLWMRKLNQILVDLRMWQPESCYRPQ
ncbi:uncharacterized protein V6R79_005244 [Siganus canaliculatus]